MAARFVFHPGRVPVSFGRTPFPQRHRRPHARELAGFEPVQDLGAIACESAGEVGGRRASVQGYQITLLTLHPFAAMPREGPGLGFLDDVGEGPVALLSLDGVDDLGVVTEPALVPRWGRIRAPVRVPMRGRLMRGQCGRWRQCREYHRIPMSDPRIKMPQCSLDRDSGPIGLSSAAPATGRPFAIYSPTGR